jgi:hypothetical protein
LHEELLDKIDILYILDKYKQAAKP